MIYRDAWKQCLCGGSFATVRWSSSSYERCRDCRGVWIREEILWAMWRDMGKSGPSPPPELRLRSDGHGPRPCLDCRSLMQRLEVLVVPIDRCAEHGVWLDADELSTLLAGAAMETEDWFKIFVEELARMT